MWRLSGELAVNFHARGPATANARSPMDARRVDGTTKSEVVYSCVILCYILSV